MGNYYSDYKKYNKTLYNFLEYKEEDVSIKEFSPHDEVCGFEILRWVLHKITSNPPNKTSKIRMVSLVKELEVEFYIQEWYDITKKDGYVNISHVKECFDVNSFDKKTEMLNMHLRAFYNICVDYILKIS